MKKKIIAATLSLVLILSFFVSACYIYPQISLDRTNFTIEVGEEYTLVATIPFASETLIVDWSSSDVRIATVNNNGTVTGISKGEAIIRAIADGAVAECVVNVIDTAGNEALFAERVQARADLTDFVGNLGQTTHKENYDLVLNELVIGITAINESKTIAEVKAALVNAKAAMQAIPSDEFSRYAKSVSELRAALENEEITYIRVAQGTYTIDEPLIIPDNKTVIANGNVIITDNALLKDIDILTNLVEIAGKNVLLQGITFQMSSKGWNTIYADRTNSVIYIRGNGTEDKPIIISDCSILGSNNEADYQYDRITDDYWKDWILGPNGSYVMSLENQVMMGIVVGYGAGEYLVIENNVFENLSYGLYFNGGNNVNIKGNTISNTRRGGIVFAGDNPLFPIKNISIIDNTLFDICYGTGVNALYDSGIGFGVNREDATINVSGNTITMIGGANEISYL